MTIHVAVFGAGGWGKNLVRVFSRLDGCHLAVVCDLDPGVRAGLAKQYPGLVVSAEPEAVLADPRIDAVVVAVDAPSHFELARAALRRKKHVFVEKPLTLSPASSAELCELARASDVRLMVGHLLLYHPALRVVGDLVARGALGRLLYVHAQRLNMGIVRADENVWWSLAAHDVAVATWLFGAEPVRVSATSATYLQEGVEDVVFAAMHFADGRIAHVHVSWIEPHKVRKLTLVGSRAMLVFDDTIADEKVRIYEKSDGARPGYASYEEGVAVRSGDITIPRIVMQEPLLLECMEFRDAILEGRAPRTPGEHGLSVVRVLAAGQASLRAGGAPVTVAEAP